MSYNATPPNDNSETALISFATSTIIAVLSPVAVAGNALILAAIWKKTFVRTPFHVFLSGLAFTDLCTGLIAQPFYVSPTLMYWVNPGEVITLPSRPRHPRLFLPPSEQRFWSREFGLNQSRGTLKCTTWGHFFCVTSRLFVSRDVHSQRVY